MVRPITSALLSLALVSSVSAQDGPLNKVGRALDQTGKNIRATVEEGVARGQITAQERDILARVGKRIDWDKKMAGSTLRLEVQPGGVVVLQGAVPSEAARLRAVDLVESTTGVTSVIDRLAIAKTVRVYESKTVTPVVEVERPVAVPAESRIIVKP